jgi:hypothetical protein
LGSGSFKTERPHEPVPGAAAKPACSGAGAGKSNAVSARATPIYFNREEDSSFSEEKKAKRLLSPRSLPLVSGFLGELRLSL